MFLQWKRRSKIADLNEGATVVLEGTVVPRTTVSIPGPNTACVWYDLLVEKFKSGMRGGRQLWLPERAERNGVGFQLEDESGRIWIGAEARQIEVSGLGREVGPLGKDGTQRYIAWRIAPGDRIRVRGLVDKTNKREPGDGLALRAMKDGRLEVVVRALTRPA